MLLHQEHKLFIFLFIFLVLFSSINLISARGFDAKTREGNVTSVFNNVTNYFNVTNASNFSDILITDIGNIDNVNDTQFNIINEILTIDISWLETAIDNWLTGITTDDLAEGTINLYDNQSFNQTHTDTLYAVSGEGNASWNESHANDLYLPHTVDTNESDLIIASNDSWTTTYNESYAGLINNASYLSTFNATYDALESGNASWNESYADTLYLDINAETDNASWNESYANGLYLQVGNESNLNVNQSGYWDNMDTINTTQMEDQGGTLNILVSWFESVFNQLFLTETTDNLTEGSNNLYDNQSWNESLADSLYMDINAETGNASWNESYANTLYAPNTTEGIQALINSTGVYSTFNATYDSHTQDNESWNQSLADTLYGSVGGIWTNDTNEARLITAQDINLQTQSITNVSNITIIDSIKDSDSNSRVYFNVNGTFVVRG